MQLIVLCDLYSEVFFFFLHDAFFHWCDSYSRVTYCLKNTVCMTINSIVWWRQFHKGSCHLNLKQSHGRVLTERVWDHDQLTNLAHGFSFRMTLRDLQLTSAFRSEHLSITLNEHMLPGVSSGQWSVNKSSIMRRWMSLISGTNCHLVTVICHFVSMK